MKWLVEGARPNDVLFFHYSGSSSLSSFFLFLSLHPINASPLPSRSRSLLPPRPPPSLPPPLFLPHSFANPPFLTLAGHGSQQRTDQKDEADGMAETICPVDYEAAGMITDDELHQILVSPLPKGCRLTAIFDCVSFVSLLSRRQGGGKGRREGRGMGADAWEMDSAIRDRASIVRTCTALAASSRAPSRSFSPSRRVARLGALTSLLPIPLLFPSPRSPSLPLSLVTPQSSKTAPCPPSKPTPPATSAGSSPPSPLLERRCLMDSRHRRLVGKRGRVRRM